MPGRKLRIVRHDRDGVPCMAKARPADKSWGDMGYFLVLICAWPALSKSVTTTALDVSEVLLLVFGAVLTIGALGEYKKFPSLLRASLATFELMVVVGIAGELLADGAIFVFSRHLQVLSEGEYATLNSEAGLARGEAGAALLEQEQLKADNLKLEALVQPRGLTVRQQKTIGNACDISGENLFWLEHGPLMQKACSWEC